MPKTVITKTDLRDSDETTVRHLFQTFGILSDPIYILDKHLKLVYSNEAFLRLIHGWELQTPQNDKHITEVLPFISDDWIADYQKIIQSLDSVME
ncbi:MAG: hypothetical protein ACW98F_07830, partial [Candidatus Hodarchaeales archaeon]